MDTVMELADNDQVPCFQTLQFYRTLEFCSFTFKFCQSVELGIYELFRNQNYNTGYLQYFLALVLVRLIKSSIVLMHIVISGETINMPQLDFIVTSVLFVRFSFHLGLSLADICLLTCLLLINARIKFMIICVEFKGITLI